VDDQALKVVWILILIALVMGVTGHCATDTRGCHPYVDCDDPGVDYPDNP